MLDFDGTLARTIPAILHASEKMLKMHGYEIDPVMVERNFGLALPEAFRCFANDPTIDDETIEQMIVEFNNIYREECEPLIELFDGVAVTLDALKRAGVTLLIASNNIRSVLERLTSRLNIALRRHNLCRRCGEHKTFARYCALGIGTLWRKWQRGVGGGRFDLRYGYGAWCQLRPLWCLVWQSYARDVASKGCTLCYKPLLRT